jgi:glutamyl-tRNA synthetase
LFKAFGAQPPAYAHIPLILNPNGTKMSKRDQGASLTSYENEGYMPEAVVNYLCLLGWSPKGNREIISLPEVAQIFDLPQILRHNARFDLEKLKWVNWEYIKAMPLGNFSVMALKALNKAGMLEKWAAAAKIMDVLRMGTLDAVRCFADSLSTDPDLAHAQDALATCKEKVKLFPEVPAFAGFYFRADFSYEEEPMRKNFNAENRPRVEKLREALAAAAAFDAGTLEAVLKKVAAEFGVKASVLVQPTRLACTGKMVGPSLYHLMEVLGRDEVLRRFDRALKWPGLGRGDLEQSR